MFGLDLAIWGFLTSTVANWFTLNGMITSFLPTAIIAVYGVRAATEIKIARSESKGVSKTKR